MDSLALPGQRCRSRKRGQLLKHVRGRQGHILCPALPQPHRHTSLVRLGGDAEVALAGGRVNLVEAFGELLLSLPEAQGLESSARRAPGVHNGERAGGVAEAGGAARHGRLAEMQRWRGQNGPGSALGGMRLFKKAAMASRRRGMRDARAVAGQTWSSEREGTTMQSPPSVQLAGVATEWFTVNCDARRDGAQMRVVGARADQTAVP